jgi:LytS/YehU family sensor histidine kinase
MPQRILNTRYKIIGHLLFWLGSIVFLTVLFYLNSKFFSPTLVAKAIITNIGFAFSVYLNLYLLIPKFLKRKNYIFYFFWQIILLTGTSLFIQLIIVYPLRNVLEVNEQFSSFSTDTHSAFFFATLLYVLLTSFLKFINDWFSMQDLNYKLAKIEKQKLEAELKTLKGQLNPHFLFNSLNNIYSLALTKSDKVPDLILRLSDLMRHIIYESRENYITLEKEIDFVDNFIVLQKIRTSGKTQINYTKTGDVPDGKIVPLLFEPFIDNAFKHGLPGTENDFIDILFDFSTPAYVLFKLRNNYEDRETWDSKNSGIGIHNVKQRLQHLYNKGDYKLSITKEQAVFSISLKLKLK